MAKIEIDKSLIEEALFEGAGGITIVRVADQSQYTITFEIEGPDVPDTTERVIGTVTKHYQTWEFEEVEAPECH